MASRLNNIINTASSKVRFWIVIIVLFLIIAYGILIVFTIFVVKDVSVIITLIVTCLSSIAGVIIIPYCILSISEAIYDSNTEPKKPKDKKKE